MKTSYEEKSLAKKVLLSVVAAGVMSGFVLSAEAADSLNVGAKDTVTKDNVQYTKVQAEGGANVTLNGGVISGFKDKHGDPDDPEDEGMIAADVATQIKDSGTTLIAKNVAFTGEVSAVNGSKIIINGGSITAGNYYYDADHGNKVEALATEIGAHDGSTIELNKVDIKSNLGAFDDGLITVNDSNIEAKDAIYAENGGTINLNSSDGNAIYSVIGQYGICADGGSINVNSGKVKASYVDISNGGQINIKDGGEIDGREYKDAEGKNRTPEAVYVQSGGKLTATNVNFYGDVVAEGNNKEGNAPEIILTGGSVNAKTYYDEETGEADGYTGIEADGGKITLNGVTVNADLRAGVDEDSNFASTIIVNNSNVNAPDMIWAEGANSTITLNGSADNVYTAKEAIMAKDGGRIYIYGGTLKADKLRDMMYNEKDEGKPITPDKGGIVLDKDGVISTMSDQIYANAASATQKESGAITNEGIDFKGGTLILNDEKYTLGYSSSALAELNKKGATKLTMSGKLITGSTVKVDEIANGAGSNIEYDDIVAKADNNLLVGSDSVPDGEIEGVNVKDKVANGFAVGSLDLATGSDGVVITNAKEVTLGGSQGGSIITVNGADTNVNVVVGTTNNVAGATATKGTLTIGNSLATADTQYKLKGNVTINKESMLNVNGKTEITDSVNLNGGEIKVAKGALKTAKLVAKDNAKLSGEVSANNLSIGDANNAGKLTIGDTNNAGKLTVENATLNGGMLFLDPAFKDGATIGDASGFAVTDASSALDGAYVAGQNSKLSFGADLKAAEAVFAKTGETWGEKGVTAAAYIAKSIDLGTAGSITVDGSKNVAPTVAVRNVTFADNSLLMVDGTETKNAAAITGVTSATVADSSKLYIDNAKKDETYKIFAGVDNGWKADNISSNNKLLKFTVDEETDDAYNVTATSQAVEDVYGKDVIAPNTFNQAVIVGGAVADFLVNAADEHVNATKAAQVSALNSAAAMSELAGVSHSTYAASNLLTDAVADHMSLANEKEHDSDIWAKYIHTKEDVDGLSVASFGADYDAQYNGIVVGADLYKNGKATVGAALTYVDGNINGNTLAARTKNDATYYGASIYGGIASDDSAVIGDISYLHGKNDITQYNSGATLTADAKSDAFSIGVRAEKSVKAGVGKFVPYAGIRYMHLGTGNYTNSIGMAYDADDMNLWLLPVGVKYSADVKTGAWTIRPIAEVGYVWNMGDRDSTQTVSLNGASDGFGYDVTDSGSYIGRFMIEAEKANVTYGLGYEYQKGDSVKANRWMANLNWKF